MEQLEDLFRNSIETDRNFPVQPAQWRQLERKLDQVIKGDERPFFQFCLVVLTMVVCQLIPGSDHRLPSLGNFPIDQRGSAASQSQVALLDAPAETESYRSRVADEQSAATMLSRAAAQQMENSRESRELKAEANPQETAAAGNLGRSRISGNVNRSRKSADPITVAPKAETVTRAQGVQPQSADNIAPLTTEVLENGDKSGDNAPVDPTQRSVDGLDTFRKLDPSASSPGITRTNEVQRNFVSEMPGSGTMMGLLLPPDMTPHPVPEKSVESQWQLSLQFGGVYDNSPRSIDYYTAGSGGGQLTQIYTFSSGDTTRLYYDGRVLEKQLRLGLRTVRLGLQRVFRSGFGARIGLLYAAGDNSNEDLVTLVPGFSNIFYFVEEYESRFMVAELGVNYTLLRDRRLQPFFGLVSILNFSTDTETRRFAQYPEQDYRQLEYRIVNRSRQLTPGFYLEMGAQYLLSEHWSIGANLASATILSAGNSSIVGIGLEVRYRW